MLQIPKIYEPLKLHHSVKLVECVFNVCAVVNRMHCKIVFNFALRHDSALFTR